MGPYILMLNFTLGIKPSTNLEVVGSLFLGFSCFYSITCNFLKFFTKAMK